MSASVGTPTSCVAASEVADGFLVRFHDVEGFVTSGVDHERQRRATMYLGCFQYTEPYRVCLATDHRRFDRQQHCDVRTGINLSIALLCARLVIGQRACAQV